MAGLPHRSLGEWAALGLLVERPSHPFALAKQMGPGGPLGKVLTVRRPQVYRAVDRLRDAGLIAADRVEPGDAGPERTVYRATDAGRRSLDDWLTEPVAHVRDLRLGFLLKLALLRRAGRPAAPLVRNQRAALAPAFAALEELPPGADEADLWRRHSAAAAGSFLEELGAREE